MKAVRLSREDLHRLGYKPGDGRGGVVQLSPEAWQEALDRAEATLAAPAIRVPRSRKPNATEQRWFLSAKARWPGLEIRYEAISFRLAAGPLYTPDFSGWDGARLVWVAEVKGTYKLGSQSRSVLAWKSAAAEWPAVTFIFAQRKNGEWAETAIGPASYCA